jgi:hypothetical protein
MAAITGMLAISRQILFLQRLWRRGASPLGKSKDFLGHKRPGVTETYAEFDPDYLSKGREAIDAYFAELGLAYTVPARGCVSEHPFRGRKSKSLGY